MSIAIKTSDNIYIYFDAVTRYSKTYPNSVTKHPIDGGGVITDHITDDNLTISLSGIISDADFGLNRPSQTFRNDYGNTSPVNVGKNSNKPSIFDVPNIFSKTISNISPTLLSDSSDTSTVLTEIKELLLSLRDSKNNQGTSKSLFSIIEYEDGIPSVPIDNCVFTSLEFSEDENTGTSLNISFSAEQVSFAVIRKTKIPQDVQAQLKDTAASKSDKGNQSSPADSVDTPSSSAVNVPRRRSGLAEIFLND